MIKSKNDRAEILPEPKRLGGVLNAENKDEVVPLGQLNQMGVTAYKKIYKGLLTQSSTDNPTVRVLENTLGDIAWTRDSAGAYTGTLTGAFTANKVFFHHPSNYQAPDLVYAVSNKPATIQFSMGRNDANSIYLNSFLATADASDVLLNVAVDDLLLNTEIFIEVYI
jgi:hypothetical protein